MIREELTELQEMLRHNINNLYKPLIEASEHLLSAREKQGSFLRLRCKWYKEIEGIVQDYLTHGKSGMEWPQMFDAAAELRNPVKGQEADIPMLKLIAKLKDYHEKRCAQVRKPIDDIADALQEYVRESGVGERRLREIEASPILPIYREQRIRDPRVWRLTDRGREIRYGKTAVNC
jgi:hypothetical protein